MAKKQVQPHASEATPVPRPPVIVVMGHVDHGKSSLLDYVRKSNIVAGEAGGITQHIGAYEVEHNYEGTPRKMTFLDTPGHAAFGAIRSRGARVADIGILVVSAEDGVKAQTLEAKQAIESAGIPFIVAVNKIDKPNADINRTHASLIEHGIYVEGYGGTIPWVPISAKTGEGIATLLDTLLLLTDVQDMKGVHDALAEGTIIEANHDKKRGMTATIIIKNGTLHKGEFVVAGHALAPVRIMEDANGKQLDSATFSTPVQLVGFDSLPDVGTEINVFTDKRSAENARRDYTPISTALWTQENANDERLIIPLIIKCDVTGSLEAIEEAVLKLTNDRVLVRIAQKGIGPVTEADMKIALTSPYSRIVCFNVSADQTAAELADQYGMKIHSFDIIYRLTEWLEEEIVTLTPKRKEKLKVGEAKVLKCFSATKQVKTVGCKILEGELRVGEKVEITRRGESLGSGKIDSIQSARQSVSSIAVGNECGMQIETTVDVHDGDTVTYYRMIEV
jgi:translation initiation factor IF-2